MAGIAPSFLTAPRLRLKVGDSILAYAVGMDIRFSVSVTPISVIGEFRPVALEPVMIGPVSGTMQIVRLLSSDSLNLKLSQTASDGAISSFGGLSPQAQVSNTTGTQPSNSVLAQDNLFNQLDTSKILLSTSFDIEVYVWRQVGADGAATPANIGELNGGKLSAELLMKVIDCRITGRTTNISMGQIVNEPVNFQGLLTIPGHPLDPFELDSSVKDGAEIGAGTSK